MVRLLHHYESTNKIFLLLEHVKGGRLIDFVSTKREQWLKLRQAAMNPPPSTRLRQRAASSCRQESRSPENTKPDESLTATERLTSPVSGESSSGQDQDQEMERMLSELTSIVPPSDLPVTESLGSEGGLSGSDATDSIDRLALMRKQLEETLEEKPETSLSRKHSAAAGMDSPGSEDSGVAGVRPPSSAAINIQPPTPTVASQDALGTRGDERTDSLSVLASKSLTPSSLDLPDVPSSSPQSRNVFKAISQVEPASSSPGRASSGRSTPCFSPGSLRNSPDVSSNQVDDWVRRLEDNVRHWAAQIVVALEHLHAHGVICRWVLSTCVT